MAHHYRLVAMTPTSVIPHQHYLVLEVIQLDQRNESLVLRVRKKQAESSTSTDRPVLSIP